jgi:ligand-binding SRPBCC domain-containing protein
MAKAHTLKTVQKLPISIDEAWEFFSNPSNLAKITPSKLGFKILSKYHGEKMYAGQIIEYTVKPLLGIPMYWMTEITQVKHKEFFIDNQRYGPYSLWHHQHHFKIIEGGVEMTDIIHYKIPLGFLGNLMNSILVKKELFKIFKYRFDKANEVLGEWKGQTLDVQLD